MKKQAKTAHAQPQVEPKAEPQVNPHVYHRHIDASLRTSLSVVSSLVRPGSRVLDLGTGSGSLGQYLAQEKQCVVDGLTYNDAEAAIARPHYQQLLVADLERCDLTALFGLHRYDAVVCADVLEHISQPERVLKACQALLAPGGQVILSIPNAGYCGLVAELLSGEFKYRPEGLLDNTHLRFFTRQSLLRMVRECAWATRSLETVERPLNESEFKLAFDTLPPAVARYLLATPDALTYQFVASIEPDFLDKTGVPASISSLEPQISQAKALFSVQLYVGENGTFSEERKLLAAGEIGTLQQQVSFPLPDLAGKITGLRLDLADRPGFMQLYSMRLANAQGHTVWDWQCARDGSLAISQTPQHQLQMRSPGPQAPALSASLLLYGDDPWLVVPVPAAVWGQAGDALPVRFDVELGWPMSADYAAMADVLAPLHDHLAKVKAESENNLNQFEQAHQTLAQQLEAVRGDSAHNVNLWREQLTHERGDKAHTVNILRGQLETAQTDKTQTVALLNEQLAFERGDKAHTVNILRGQLETAQADKTQTVALLSEQLAFERGDKAHTVNIMRGQLESAQTDKAQTVMLLNEQLAFERGDKANTINLLRGQWEKNAEQNQAELSRVRGKIATLIYNNGALDETRRTLSDEKTKLLAEQTRLLAAHAELQKQWQAEQLALHGEKTALTHEMKALSLIAASTQTALDQSAERINALAQQQAALQAEKAALSQQHAALMQAHDHTRGERDGLASHQQQLEHQATQLNARIAQLQTDLSGLQQHLSWIENSTVFRLTRPLVRLKMWLQGTLDETVPSAPVESAKALPMATLPYDGPRGPVHPVDVIVPVYKGLDDTRRCIESVLANPCKTPWRLVILNDASPEPEVTAWLREVQKRDPRIVLLENAENLGFVGTVNRGMSQSTVNDVVLLNSDAEVANDWLDRLGRAAYCDHRIASVTPFSNNATICSYPRFCEANPLPVGFDTAALDHLFAAENAGQVVDVPTGIGFCMYIRRASLDEVGLFDVANFGKGYGEENDYCCRAAAAGWRNLHALDTFVHHAGGVSFGASKSAREQAAMETLRRLHPDYEREVHQFIPVDPAQYARRKVDLARIRTTPLPVVLCVLHDRAGGTVRHVQELAVHLQQHALFLTLKPAPQGRISIQIVGSAEALDLNFDAAHEFPELVAALRELGISHIHYHHLLGHQASVMALPQALGVAYDFTAHDYYAYCPQISLTDHSNAYCGEKGLAQCSQCLQKSAAPGGLTIEEWKAPYAPFLAQARHVYAPSVDAAQRVEKAFPGLSVRAVPHVDLAATPLPIAKTPRLLGSTEPLRVVVIGAMSIIKGADVVEDVAALAASQNVPVDIHLLGFAYRSLRTTPGTCLTVHGEYKEHELAAKLAQLKPDLVWFPAQWPETYSYTLSAALAQGLPVLAVDLGAFAERLVRRPWSWTAPWNATPQAWVALLTELRTQHFMTGTAPPTAPPKAPEVSAPLSAIDLKANSSPWSYEKDYFEGIKRTLPAPSPAQLALLQQAGLGQRTGAAGGIKETALLALVYLRALPALRSVARAIPLRWQTRVKTWLRS